MALLPPGTIHVLWTRFLFRLGTAERVIRVTRALGWCRYFLAGSAERRRKRELYLNYLAVTENNPPNALQRAAHLTREQMLLRPLLGIAPALMAHGPQRLADDLVKFIGLENMEAAMAPGRGLILVSTHFGAAGTGGASLVRKGHKMVLIRDIQFQKYYRTPYAKYLFIGGEPLFVDRDGPTTQVALLRCRRALKDNQIVAYLADAQRGARTAKGLVFGREATFRSGIVGIARLAGSPVVPMFSYFENGRIHSKFFEPIWVKSEEDIEKFGAQFAAVLEEVIRTAPHCLIWDKWDQELFSRKK